MSAINQAEMSQAEFARHLGVARSYITLLKKNDRLILTEDGKINVEASKEKIAATEDPGKTGVSQRHAKNRAGQGSATVHTEKEAKTDSDDEATPDYQKARARKESANAQLAEMEAAKAAGLLLETTAVVSALADAGTTLRVHLQTLPAILAPQVATLSDENQIRLLLEDHIEQTLSELSHRLASAVKESGAQ